MFILNMVWILLMQARFGISQKIDCASGPCQNEALCQDTESGFLCFCVDGYAGELCETNFDDCSSTPCRNNATCVDLVANYTCLCATGFTGQDCQLNVDECQSNPCLRNGTCIDLVNGFICECIPPYRGDNCSLLPCDTVPCENEAVCRNDLRFNESLSGFVCDCITGFTGPRCEINLEDCDLENLTSCSGNGLCVDGINDYSCLCEPGWVGDDCESPVDDCIGSSCKNNATCTDQHLSYLCTCQPEYEGSLCEREKDECSEWQPCKNGAVCLDLFDDYNCECAEGWFGDNCTEKVNDCETNECQNGAQCLDVIGGFQCRCPPFFTGLLCETLYNPCAPGYNPCKNGANCIVPPNGKYRCFCAAGFSGIHCEVNVNECLSLPCENNATCEDVIAGHICHCTLGWEGQNCQDNIDDCASEPCLNGADCMDLHNGYECNCTREYQGPKCDEAVDFCLKHPCYHDSTCLSVVGGYSCLCSSPYTGDQCLELIDSCQSAPCENNGTCMNTESGFICSCPLPFTGKTCKDRVDFCESEPCFLGTCVSLENDFVCACPEYITGKHCTDLVDYCGDSPCQNEGNCINGESDFRCSCAYGFIGRVCTEMIDFCGAGPCQNTANCTNIPGGFICACPFEFTGDLCQNILPTVISSSPEYASSSFSQISSKDIIISSLHHSTMSVFSSSASDFNISTVSSVSKIIISTLISQDMKSLTVIPKISGTTSMLHVLKTSSSVYPSFSVISKSTLGIEPSSVSSTSQLQSPEKTTFDIKPSFSEVSTYFSGTVRSGKSEAISSILATSMIISVYSPATKKTDNMSSSGVKSLFVTSFMTDTFVMSSILATSSLRVSTFTGHMSLVSSTDGSLSLKDSLISSLSVRSSFSKLPYFSTDSVFMNISSTVVLHSTGTSSLITDVSVSSKSSYIESTISVPSTSTSASSVSMMKISGVSLSTSSLNSYSVISATLSSYLSVVSTYFKHISSSMLTDTDISSTSSSTNLPDKHTLGQSTLLPDTFSPTSISTFSTTNNFHSSTISKESSSTFNDLVTPTSIFETLLIPTSLATTSFDEMSTYTYSLNSIGQFSTTALKSASSYIYTFSDNYFSSSSIVLSSVRYISVSMSEKQTHSSIYEASLASDTITKPSTISVFSTSGIRSSREHSSQVSYTLITSFTQKDLSTNTMSEISSDLETYSDSKDSPLLLSTSHEKSTAFDSFTLNLKSSEYTSRSSALSDFSPLTLHTSLSSMTTFSSDIPDTLTFTHQEKTDSLSVSEFMPYSTIASTKKTSFIEATSLQGITLSSDTFETVSTFGSSKSSDISITVSHSIGVYSSQTNPSSAPFSFSDAISQIDSSLHISTVVLDGSTTNNMISASKSFTTIRTSKSHSKEMSSLQSSFNIDSIKSPMDRISPTSSLQHLSSGHLILSSTLFDSTIFRRSMSVSFMSSIVTKTVASSEGVQPTYTTTTATPSREARLTSIQTSSEIINPTKSLNFSKDVLTKSVHTSGIIHTKPLTGEGVQPSKSIYSSEIVQPKSDVTPAKTDKPTNTVTSKDTSRTAPVTSSIFTTTTVPPTTCDNFVCYNSGVCREDVSGTFCDCGDRYLGRQCQTESTACKGYVCENNGFCVVTLTVYNVQVPKCNCPLPFVGSRCESEKLIYYPTFIGSSYLKFSSLDMSPDLSNEIYISVKTTQREAIILHSANRDVDYKQAAFISLFLTNGKLRYSFSCDGVMVGIVETDMIVNTGDVYGIVIRQSWSAGPGEWCSAAVIINSRAFVSGPILAVKKSQALGKLYIGGRPRFTYHEGKVLNTHIIDGYIGCVHNFQVNKKEIDLVTMATEGINIDNCNVPVCQHNPCRNGATCYSSGEEWYCSCLPGYGGSLCERKLCGVNPCQHGGTCIILEEEQDQLCLCAYGRAGSLCEKALSVTLPHFIGTQYDHSSYIAYDHPHYLENDFEMEFSMILDNGSSDSSLVMFLGNAGSYDGRGDFMEVGIEKGYVVFRFDLGSGYGQIYSAEELDLSLQQHRIKLGRDRYTGWIQTDNQRNVTGRSPGILTALNTNSKLYIGNIEFSEIGILPTGSEFDDGFKGCIFNLKIKSHITDFLTPGSPPGHVISGRNIGQCSSLSCDENPCRNGADCRDLGASIYCVCVEGWKGTFCTDVITVCDLAHTCLSGSTCVPISPEGYTCWCPLGKKGEYCEQDLNISDPLFLGEGSYMSFEPVYIKRKIDIQIQMKPIASEGLLFYITQRLHSHAGDFLSLTLNNGKVELRIDMGTGVNIIRNEVELSTEQWFTIEAGRNISHGYISVDGDSVTAQLAGMMTFLDTTTDFYIGGLTSLDDASPDAFENEPVSFQGCIRKLLVNSKQFQLNRNGAKDGRNIDDCDGTSCGYSVCQTRGNCSVHENATFSCSCTQSYVGRTCEIPVVCSNHKCLKGKCRANGDDGYVCDCFLGSTGKFCDEDIILETSVELATESFIYLVDEDFANSNKSKTDISFAFKVTKPTGLIFWNGQTYSDDEDYLGVGIQDGRLKLVWNVGWYSRGEIFTSVKFNDEGWHMVVIKREKQSLTLDVDGVTYDNRVSGDFFNLDTFGEYFIGSFKEGHVADMTLGHFTEPLRGCLKDLQLSKGAYVDFNTANDGINIVNCSGN